MHQGSIYDPSLLWAPRGPGQRSTTPATSHIVIPQCLQVSSRLLQTVINPWHRGCNPYQPQCTLKTQCSNFKTFYASQGLAPIPNNRQGLVYSDPSSSLPDPQNYWVSLLLATSNIKQTFRENYQKVFNRYLKFPPPLKSHSGDT